MATPELQPTIDLTELAKKAMRERNLLIEFLPEVERAAEEASLKFTLPSSTIDMTHLLWCSIDNDDSKDLDQLTYAEQLSANEEKYKIYIAIAEVDHLVSQNSIIDRHAQYNTVSVYTPTKVFPMLPERLSTDFTSLNENENRLAIVVEAEINQNGSLGAYTIYSALVRNYAKLAYNSVSAWLDGDGSIPKKIDEVIRMKEQLKLQDHITTLLKKYRHEKGALTLETIESKAIIENNHIIDIKTAKKNRARDLIEEFMITANTCTALYLKFKRLPSFRRVVRVPKRWERIVEIAREHGETLPDQPDSKALDLFLIKRKFLDPLHFPDLSLTIIKLLGNGEYIVEYYDDMPIGHFGLALTDYTHSTAPNRRYPDLITQRIIKAALNNQEMPYTSKELEKLAKHCTIQENEADKVERQMKKSAAILLLYTKFDEVFDAIITGAGPKGTWVRIFHPPVDGKLIGGFENKDVGDSIRVKLTHLDIENGHIDFVKV
jgi:exoribonuclease-2